MINKNDSCRLCGSKTIDLIFKMPSFPPVDNFRKIGEPELNLPHFPMDLYMCGRCRHAQLLDVVSPTILYGNYIYTSSSSPDLNRHFADYAVHVSARFNLIASSRILDIGSNDGLFLSKFKEMGFEVLGVDPSEYVASLAKAKGIKTIVGFLNKQLSTKIVAEHGKMDLITANNVFSHADNLLEFAFCVNTLLADEGTFVFEVSYLKDLVDHFVIDYIYHEHLCYHSVLPLKQFLESCHLKLIDIERVPTKGGSIRCYAMKSTARCQPKAIVKKMIAEEMQSGLYERATYQALEKRVQAIRENLIEMLQKEIAAGNKVAAYGASATSTVLNSILGIAGLISFIIDDNVDRQGRLSPGYFTPVLSSEALIENKPSLTVISAWRFAEGIIKKNQRYKLDGGRFIVPMPTLRME